MIVQMARGEDPIMPKVSEITVIRYYEEIVIRNEDSMKFGSNSS
jgi:hypothetical protein